MKKPVLVLAITAFATFVMGWVAHRVYRNTKEAETETSQVSPKTITPAADSQTDTSQAASKPDSFIYQHTVYNPPVADSSASKKQVAPSRDSSIKAEDPEEKILYKPAHGFSEFPAGERYRGPFPKKLDFSTCSSGQLYKKETRLAMEKGMNFGGRFVFTKIPCGADCYSSTLLDLKTGKVYAGPHAVNGYKFKAESRMLLVNPPDSNGYYTPCEVCEPLLYVFNGKKFVRVE